MNLLLAAAMGAALLTGGCGEAAEDTSTIPAETGTVTGTATAAPYTRRSIEFFEGIAEPTDWHELLSDSERLLEDGFNTVTLAPPVFITPRAGGRPRVILEGQAATAEALIDDFHERGLAVHISPTTRIPGYNETVEPGEATLGQLKDDALSWARKAEENQAELFSPLSDYNLVLGVEAANAWSAEVLPLVRAEFTGLVGAKVLANIDGPPEPGQPHDFERLDYNGYDYLMLDVFPTEEVFDFQQYDYYVIDVLDRAGEVARRDGLKGVIVSEFGSWRSPADPETADGPVIDEDTQALLVLNFLVMARPRTQGVFFHGWTLTDRGARDTYAEDVIRDHFTKDTDDAP